MTNVRLFCTVLATGAALTLSHPARAQNLIVNSNFATGDFTGWSVAETGGAGEPSDYGVTSSADGGVRVPNTGDTYGAYFNPAGGTMNLTQSVTLPGAGTYLLTCAVRPVINDADAFTIYLAGAPVFATNFEVGAGYTEISVTVSATSGAQVIDFEFAPGSGPMFFDDAGLVPLAVAQVPTPASVLSGAAGAAVIGLDGTDIDDFLADIHGDVYVSKNGSLENLIASSITGNVVEYKEHQYSGRGRLTGDLSVNPNLLDTANTDALDAADSIAAMTPTQVLGPIRRPTVVTGNGGLNVINIRGDIRDSLVLSGGANDVFFVNVSGTIILSGRASLSVDNGVTSDAVLYNLTGSGAVEINILDRVSGTILAPGYTLDLAGDFDGAVIGGGHNRAINLLGARITLPAGQ